MTDPPPSPPSRLRRWLPLLGRVVVFGLLAGWLVFFADLQAFAEAFAGIDPVLVLPATALAAVVLMIGGVRWRVLMKAFGGQRLPSTLSAVRLFYIGLFYNTFVPGSFGGDVVRGVVTRRYFDNAPSSYVVVLLERAIGFSAMGLVFLLGVAIGPDLVDLRDHLPWLALLFGMGIAVVAAALVSGKLAATVRQVPKLHSLFDLVLVFALSLVSHFCGLTVMWLLSIGMGLGLSYGTFVLVMPVVFTAAVIPLNILGIGTREVTLVALLGLAGVEAERALALSLCYAVINLGLAAIGGLIQLVQGRIGAPSPTSE